MAVEDIEKHCTRNNPFAWFAGPRRHFTKVWIMPKHRFDDFNDGCVRLFTDLTFPVSMEAPAALHPTFEDGRRDFRAFRVLVGMYLAVCTAGNQWIGRFT